MSQGFVIFYWILIFPSASFRFVSFHFDWLNFFIAIKEKQIYLPNIRNYYRIIIAYVLYFIFMNVVRVIFLSIFPYEFYFRRAILVNKASRVKKNVEKKSYPIVGIRALNWLYFRYRVYLIWIFFLRIHAIF